MKNQTTKPVKPGKTITSTPEFGRVADVQRLYGIKRGTLYNLLMDGKVKGCLLRIRGNKSGVRLFDMASVRGFILAQMDQQTPVRAENNGSLNRNSA